MLEITLDTEKREVDVKLTGRSLLAALKTEIVIDVDSIEKVTVADKLTTGDFIAPFTAIRVGTYAPYYVAMGTFYTKDTHNFLYFHEDDPGIIIELKPGHRWDTIALRDRNADELKASIELLMDK